MKYFVLALVLVATVACCTPGNCPPGDIYINAVLEDGSQVLVKIPKGTLDDRDSYYTLKEIQEIMENNIQAY